MAVLALLALGLVSTAHAGNDATPVSVSLSKAAVAARILAEVTGDNGALTEDSYLQFWGIIPEQLRESLADESYRQSLIGRMFAGLEARYDSALLSLERGDVVKTEDYERANRMASDSLNELVAALTPRYPAKSSFVDLGAKFILAAANGTPIPTSLGKVVLTRELVLQLRAKEEAALERLAKLLTPPAE